MDTILEVENVSKTYGKYTVLQDINFRIESNQCIGLIGHNGAGKTTLMEILMGIRNTTEGSVVWKENIKNDFKRNIGVQLQETALFQKMKVYEALDLFSDLYQVPKQQKESIIKEFSLHKMKDKYVSKLSGGWKHKLSLSLSLLHNPSFLFLDEPTTGLDPEATYELWKRIEALRGKKKTVLLTTHNMKEVEKYCDKVMILRDGKLVKYDYVDKVRKELGNTASMDDVYMHYCSRRKVEV